MVTTQKTRELISLLEQIVERKIVDVKKKQREILQLKLAALVHKFYLSKDANHDVGVEYSILDWAKHLAKEYAKEFDEAHENIELACESYCPFYSCKMVKYKAHEIIENPELLEKCPFSINLLHYLLNDGHPVDKNRERGFFYELTGRELPEYASQ